MLSNSKNKKAIIWIIALLSLALLASVGYIIWLKVSTPTSSPNYTNGQVRNQSSSSDSGQGGVTDLNASSQPNNTTTPPSSPPATKVINLTSPTADSTVKPSSILSGTSSLSLVEYRLVDNEVGVISQGELSVVNGSFSGVLHFTPHSNKGILVVFSYDPNNGSEINSTTIPVSLAAN